MAYKVGDRVRIRRDIISGGDYDGLYFNPDMDEFRGRTLVISTIDYRGHYATDDSYAVSRWFNDAMLEPAPPEERKIYTDSVEEIFKKAESFFSFLI